MDERHAPDPAPHSPPPGGADVAHLSLSVQRLMDAALLLPEEGGALLAAAYAARRTLKAGDAKAAQGHLVEFAHLTEALVRSDALSRAEGQAVPGTVCRLLGGTTG